MSAPLTPADCDCRGLPFMPLEVGRLVDSDFTALSTGDEFKAGFLLWAKSWTQVPAASIPDDDRILARLTGLNLADWQRVKPMALHGWVKCSDGRLYHPVIADLAIAASEKRRGQAARANSRWAKVKAAKAAETRSEDAPAVPRQAEPDATASEIADPAMQGTVEVEGRESPPVSPPSGGKGLFELTGEPDPDPPKDEAEVAFELWNETARRCGLPVAKVLDDGRRKAIRKRLEAGGLDGWRAALEAVEASAFCRGLRPGRDGRSFKADLGFVCQAKSYQRLVEGFYGADAPPPAKAQAPVDPDDRWRSRMREFRRNGYWNTTDWEAKPGKPGCIVPAAVLAEFGYPTEGADVVAFPGRAVA